MMPGEKEATGRDGTGQTPFEEANPRMGVVLLLLLWSTTFGEGGENVINFTAAVLRFSVFSFGGERCSSKYAG